MFSGVGFWLKSSNLINGTGSSSLVGQVMTGFGRRVVTFQQNPRKKGARRRKWWHPKLLHNRLYKGYGSGTMMKRLESGEFVFDADKERVFVAPEVGYEDKFKPYVEDSAPKLRTPSITKWDFLARMEETWGTEAEEKFVKYSQLEGIGRKSGKLGKWGA